MTIVTLNRRPEPGDAERLNDLAWRRIIRMYHLTGDDRDLYHAHRALMLEAGWQV